MTIHTCDCCKGEVSKGDLRELHVGGYRKTVGTVPIAYGNGPIAFTSTFASTPNYTPVKERRLELCPACEDLIRGKLSNFIEAL